MYLRAIEIHIYPREIECNRVYLICLAQTTIHDFSKYCIELIVALSLTNATKTVPPVIAKKAIGCWSLIFI